MRCQVRRHTREITWLDHLVYGSSAKCGVQGWSSIRVQCLRPSSLGKLISLHWISGGNAHPYRAEPDAFRRAIAVRRGSCLWDLDHASWVVTLHSPEEQDFSGQTLGETLAWCQAWLMAPEIGVGPFMV